MSYDPSLYYGHPFYYGRYGAMPTAQYSNGSYGQASAQSSYNFNAPGAPMMYPGNQGYSAYYPQSYYQQSQYAPTNPGMLNGHQMAQQQVSMQYRSTGQMTHAQSRSSGHRSFSMMANQSYVYSTAPGHTSAQFSTQMAPATAPMAPTQPIAQPATQIAPASQPIRPTIPNPVRIPVVAPVSTITQDLPTDDHECSVVSRKRPPVTTTEDQEPIQKKARVEEAPCKVQNVQVEEDEAPEPAKIQEPTPVEEIPVTPEAPEPTLEVQIIPMTFANKEFLDCLAELEESSSPESVKDSEADSDSNQDSDDVEDEEDSDCFGEISDSEDEEEDEVVFLKPKTPKAKTPKVKKFKKRVVVMVEEEEDEPIKELDEYTKGIFEKWGLTYAPFKRSEIVSVVNMVVGKREAKGLTNERLPKRLRQ